MINYFHLSPNTALTEGSKGQNPQQTKRVLNTSEDFQENNTNPYKKIYKNPCIHKLEETFDREKTRSSEEKK